MRIVPFLCTVELLFLYPHSLVARSSGVVAAVRMILLLLPLLATAASGVQLINHFECGSDTVFGSTWLAEVWISSCNYAVKNDTNLCCKEHDLCYELHLPNNHTREFCDAKFCNCLLDASDRTKNYNCSSSSHTFCKTAKAAGGGAFTQSVPNAKIHAHKYAEFEDARPLGLDMQRLVDACAYAKDIAVHCHNTVYECLTYHAHERFRRLDVVEYSYQDCRSTMHDCMQMVMESEPNNNCSAVARDIAKQVNTYMELGHIEPCLLNFHDCGESPENRVERPEVHNAARRIKIGCHRELRTCIDAATVKETSEDCIEARNLAVGRIRDKDLKDVKRSIRAGRGYLAAIDGGRR